MGCIVNVTGNSPEGSSVDSGQGAPTDREPTPHLLWSWRERQPGADKNELRRNNCRFIKIAFQQEGKVIAVHAKRARGLMVRYISENQLEDVDEIRQFALDGYGFCEDKSNANMMVFDRRKNWKDEPDSDISTSIKKRKNKNRVTASKKAR